MAVLICKQESVANKSEIPLSYCLDGASMSETTNRESQQFAMIESKLG